MWLKTCPITCDGKYMCLKICEENIKNALENSIHETKNIWYVKEEWFNQVYAIGVMQVNNKYIACD